MWGRRRECRQRVAHRGAKPVGASDSHSFSDRASPLGNQNWDRGSGPVHDQPAGHDADQNHDTDHCSATDLGSGTGSGSDHC
jgi:hypothetical protein